MRKISRGQPPASSFLSRARHLIGSVEGPEEDLSFNKKHMESYAEPRFRTRAGRSSPEEGLALLDELERRHRAGYESTPVEPGEFSDWEDEQVWPPDDETEA